MTPNKDISLKSNKSRRLFLGLSLKLTTLGVVFFPLKKALGNSSHFIIRNTRKLSRGHRRNTFNDKLILNTKTKVVHLPTEKIFKTYPDIAGKNQKIIDINNWEVVVKAPFHFHKEKSGVIIEILALQKLVNGINDKNLTAAINTLAIAFTPEYKNPKGILINKYNFRLHELLATLIGLNNSILSFGKWTMFQNAIGKLDYSTNEKGFPGYMNWIKTKNDFDKRVTYIRENKTDYITRLKERVAIYKL